MVLLKVAILAAFLSLQELVPIAEMDKNIVRLPIRLISNWFSPAKSLS
jgi:hypothetical protein